MIDIDLEAIISKPKKYNKAFFRKNYPEFYEQVLKCDGETFAEKLYVYLTGVRGKCVVCGDPTKFRGLAQGYSRTCCLAHACKDDDRIKKIKATKQNKYGDANYNNRQKFIETSEAKYGGAGFGSDITSQKIKNTCIDRYGVENPSSVVEINEKRINTFNERYGGVGFGSDITSQKIKQTNIERYGDENYSNHEQAIQTCIDRYGVPNIMLNKDFLEDRFRRFNELFGGRSPWSSKSVRNRSRQTLIEHYGVDNPMKSDEIKQKSLQKQIANLKKKHPFLINVKNGEWICKCPHPECNKCQERQFITYSNIQHTRINCHAETCTKLRPIGTAGDTNIELFIERILNKLGLKYIKHDRIILRGKELDFYIPSKNIAIECNGLRFHSTSRNQTISKPKTYHLDKYNDLLSQNIRLISIWEDWVLTKPHIIENILRNKLGYANHKIYARNCIIHEINKEICDDFLNNYHLQGTCKARYRYGLYNGDELVAVMTFGHRMISARNEWELLRYCCKADYSIIGGAGKLLKHFIRQIHPDTIVSYSSNDISDGNVYKTLGFIKSSNPQLSYWYVDKKTMHRYHRTKFTKRLLQAKGYTGTEFEIMDSLPYWRIYDTGTIRWELKKENF